VQGQTTYSTYSPRAGNTRTSWLTGAAAWSYYSATQYILGIRPEVDGLRIDPCIPSEWEGFTVHRKFRGCTFEIRVKNPQHVYKGVASLEVNGKQIVGNLIRPESMQAENLVEVVLG
jgi:cellobiose phosphorylase